MNVEKHREGGWGRALCSDSCLLSLLRMTPRLAPWTGGQLCNSQQCAHMPSVPALGNINEDHHCPIGSCQMR